MGSGVTPVEPLALRVVTDPDAEDEAPMALRTIRLAELTAGLSPRSTGLDASHVETLVQAAWPVEPIIVNLRSMQIIDGHHRVAAATALRHRSIRAYLFDGPLDAAYVIGVRTNVLHGLPLSMADRRAAVRRILRIHQDWSDRAIASATGTSAEVVQHLRCSADDERRWDGRIERDGRRKSLSTTAKRLPAAEMLSATPRPSIAEVAQAVSLSPSTVRDVRTRLARGANPVPSRILVPTHGSTGDAAMPATTVDAPEATRAEELSAADLRGVAHGAGSVPVRASATAEEPTVDAVPSVAGGTAAVVPEGPEVAAMLETLTRDPSLRMTGSGRDLLRWLHAHAVNLDDGRRAVHAAPDHSLEFMAALARRVSANWAVLAHELTERVNRNHATNPA